MEINQSSSQCPQCGEKLEKKPTRKMQCPHCSVDIIVRKGELITEKILADRKLKRKWLRTLNHYGANEELFVKNSDELSKEFGFPASVNDVLWRMMNTLTSNQESLLDLELLYRHMGNFLDGEGKDPTPLYRQAAEVRIDIAENKNKQTRAQIKGQLKKLRRSMMRESDIPHALYIFNCNDHLVCKKCRSVEGKNLFYNIEEIDNFEIPYCTAEYGCRCWASWTTALGELYEN